MFLLSQMTKSAAKINFCITVTIGDALTCFMLSIFLLRQQTYSHGKDLVSKVREEMVEGDQGFGLETNDLISFFLAGRLYNGAGHSTGIEGNAGST